MSRTLALVTSSWFICGCVVNEDSTAFVDQYGLSPNGLSPNGLSPNGLSPNGLSPNGLSPNEIIINGLSPNGLSPNGVELNGLSPNGLSPNGTPIGIVGVGTPLSGAGLVGSTWTGHLSDGTNVTIRVDQAQQLTGTNTDVWSYQLSGLVNGTFHPLCVDAAGAPGFAVSVTGTWNLSQGTQDGGSYHAGTADFSIACRGSAIAKCVEPGFKPWRDAIPELAACVRALRADYCGDGTPHTVNGTMVNIFDDRGIQADAVDWVPEAEWTPEGATCVSKKKNTRFDQVTHETPACFPHALKPENSCGTGFSGGAAIITELAPR